MSDFSRRQVIKTGLGALAIGLQGPLAFGRAADSNPTSPLMRHRGRGNPFEQLKGLTNIRTVGGFPFLDAWTGDGFSDDQIPFHGIPTVTPQPPEDDVEVAVIGGGISGLTAAYLLRQHRPVLFELRDRFGGNASGENWKDTFYSLGCAYVITPDSGSFLDTLYSELGLDQVRRESFPPDPMELNGMIRDDFWSGAGMPPADQEAFARYAAVVLDMAENNYPEIPLPKGKDNQWIRDLDRRNFLDDVEQRMGVPMPTILKAGVQSYFYSSFGWGMEHISAASGWNFVAAEEFGRWIFPGGCAYMAHALWEKLRAVEKSTPGPQMLRPHSQVIDVRIVGDRTLVTWIDSEKQQRTIRAKKVVMANSKHICKYVLNDLQMIDNEKYNAFGSITTQPYIVANVLLEAPIQRDFYDIFLLRDGVNFPFDQVRLENESRPMDVLNGDFARTNIGSRRVLTLYWPLPFSSALFSLLLDEPFDNYANKLVPRLHEILALLDVPPSAVKQIRMSRWGHAMPIASPSLIADGICDLIRRPIQDKIYFVNQDNWALPAVENSVLDAKSVTDEIAAALPA